MISCILMSLMSFVAFWGQIFPSSFALLLQLGSFSISFNELLDLGNYASVLFFGIVAALYLADIPFLEHKRLYLFTLLGFSSAQFVFYLLLGTDRLYRCYPFLIHLPLILLIHFMLHRNLYISIIAVLTAYLLCTPRKWAGTLAASFFGYDPVVSNIVTILVTLPMLYLVIRFISPYVIRLKYENKTILSFFFLLPLSYYVLEYAFTVYTDLLYTGGPAVIDFMDTFIVLLYFILSTLTLNFSNQIKKAEHENILLTVAAAQAQKEISQLSDSQHQAAIYRHDLRHHMNFLKSSLLSGNTDQALSYINEICTTLDNSRIVRYSENDALNLILSYYAQKALSEGITVDISVTTADFSRFQITSLCSLFANALENALHACQQMQDKKNRYIRLKLYEKNDRLCINMVNSYEKEPLFENEIPVSHAQGHGLGIASIISIVKNYHGIYGFYADHGEFHFQASL